MDKLARALPNAVQETYIDRTGGDWAVLRPEAIREAASFLKNDPELDFKLFLSMDAVDRLMLPQNDPRFEVVYFLFSLRRNEHLRFKCRVAGDPPQLPSLTSVFQGANWFERFVWDFYGIRFEGHPNLRRILMYEEFEGYPLRKDYPLRARQPLIPERPIEDIFRGPGTNRP
ncbi:MAG TPA: NADH-quinone oxidoreductase subunit C [Myxococcaceae bacterium]|nr:NADH-quinone oxidoreductase subunit C [Myxococcaceae bacterium]